MVRRSVACPLSLLHFTQPRQIGSQRQSRRILISCNGASESFEISQDDGDEQLKFRVDFRWKGEDGAKRVSRWTGSAIVKSAQPTASKHGFCVLEAAFSSFSISQVYFGNLEVWIRINEPAILGVWRA